MKDIKEKPIGRMVRTTNPVKCLPKTLSRKALLTAKERTKEAVQDAATAKQDKSPENYAADTAMQTGERIVYDAGRVTYSMGKKLTKKAAYTIKERKAAQRVREVGGQPEVVHTDGRRGSESTAHAAPKADKEKIGEIYSHNIKERPLSSIKSVGSAAPPNGGTVLPAGKKAVGGEPQPLAVREKVGISPKLRRQVPPAKGPSKTIKTVEKSTKQMQTAHQAARQTKQAAKVTAKASKKAVYRTKQAVRTATQATKTTGKAAVSAVKAAVLALKSLVMAIAAGGSVAVVTILAIGLVAVIVGSGFGIFMSGQDSGTGQTMRTAVSEINAEYNRKIEEIKSNNTYDKLKLSGVRASWPDVLSLYAVKTTTDPEHGQEVASMDDNKKALLKKVFWDIHSIASHTETKSETNIVETDDGNGNIIERPVEVLTTYLYITVTHKTVSDMSAQYGFADFQVEQLGELQKPEHQKLWQEVLFGISSGGSSDIVAVALSQVGNVGGEPYWSWYGFGGRVEWCACFISWCANQCGYIEAGIIPKFAGCTSGGMAWFKEHNQWQERDYVPNPGCIVFFDWASNGLDGDADHVGIVEKVEDGRIFTVEGNSGDMVRQNSYPVGYYEIRGYGVPIS